MDNFNDYYIGVDDVTWYIEKKTKYEKFGKVLSHGYVNQIPIPYAGNRTVFTERNFSQKFVNSPELAIINVFYQDHSESNDPFLRAELFDGLYFDEKTNCYAFDEYLTLDAMLPPKEAHWQKFLEGDYALYRIHHEIQALKTTAVEVDLQKEQKKWNKLCEEICKKKCKHKYEYELAEKPSEVTLNIKGTVKPECSGNWKVFVDLVENNVPFAAYKTDDSKTFYFNFDIND